ncbi:hypothetical protein [Streptomyces chartreusis]|uniref:hypothetical protein n=1 Tax=Streptomyces chartreusis TaxID=1969 RepID=UPI00381E3C47
MTAPTTPRMPTPGDLARRQAPPRPAPPASAAAPTKPTVQTRPTPREREQRPVTAADCIAPGVLRPGERMRSLYQQAMRTSRMQPEARLVALTLLGYANFKTGVLNRHQPGTEQLAYATGLTNGQVLVQIEVLTQRGWLHLRTLTRGPREGQSVFQLCIPAFALQQLRDRAAHATC